MKRSRVVVAPQKARARQSHLQGVVFRGLGGALRLLRLPGQARRLGLLLGDAARLLLRRQPHGTHVRVRHHALQQFLLVPVVGGGSRSREKSGVG
jgi:hypothetical protein